MKEILPQYETPALEELAKLKQWICWKLQEVKNGKPKKIPWTPYGVSASVKESSHWELYGECYTEVVQQKYKNIHRGLNGVGFVFSEDDPYVGIDLDNCRDPKTGKLDDWAMELVNELNTYTEVSPSGTGVHMICKGDRMDTGHNRRTQSPEMYTWGRYFTFTGQHVEGTPDDIRDRTKIVKEVEKRFFGYNVKSTVGDESIPDSAFGLDEVTILTNADINKISGDSDLFHATWNHQRDDEYAGDMSRYDMSLAVQGIQMGYTPAKVAQLIVSHRHSQSEGGRGPIYEKAFRIDYIRRTYFNALQWVKSRTDGEEAEIREVINQGGDVAIAELSHKLGLSITRVIKRSHPGMYYLVWHDIEICLGNSEQLRIQDKVAAAISDATGQVLGYMTKKKWLLYVRLLHACAEFEELDGADEIEEIESLVQDYLDSRGSPGTPWKDLASMGRPFVTDGVTYINRNDFRSYLSLMQDYRIKPRELLFKLKGAKFEVCRVQCTNSHGEAVNKRYWRKQMSVDTPQTANELIDNNAPENSSPLS